MKYKPTDISEFTDTTLLIRWEDGYESIHLYEELRELCPCAKCSGKRGKSAKRSFKKSIPLGSITLQPERIEFVGNYAIRFKGNNWCDNGIYTFDYLRESCQSEGEYP